ncbi:MAG: hypothetical protein NTV79_10300 [Candidatus Aureabacteria bacterium]|nr:hypothetical protein [Candidatus Auribacterota bacterium]
MFLTALILSLAAIRAAPPLPSPAAPGSPPPPAIIFVEGVAATRVGAPLAALRDVWERLLGLNFAILDGKYVELGEGAVPPSVDTQRKRLIELKELPGGLFRARLEVEAPEALVRAQEKLREVTVRGEAEIAAAGSVLSARGRAREDALEKAVLAAAAEVYPPSSVPEFIEGRVFYLETLREAMEEGSYRLTARIKVELMNRPD